MEIKPTKRKKSTAPLNYESFPSAARKPFTASFAGLWCHVENRDDMADLFEMGFYGKGSLSRSEPEFNTSYDDLPPVLLEQQWQNRKRNHGGANNKGTGESTPVKEQRLMQLGLTSISAFLQSVQTPKIESWGKYKNKSHSQDSLLQVAVPTKSHWNLCETENNNFCSTEIQSLVANIMKKGKPREAQRAEKCNEIVVVGGAEGPRLETTVTAPRELLQLNLQETFFLSGVLGKLNVIDQAGNIMSSQEMWTMFRDAEPQFVQRYAVYHWYRSQGWVVRSGLKYGGDFLLYEKGPSFCHSSCLVRLHFEDTRLKWNDLACIQRLVETFKKDIIFCCVMVPADLKEEDWLSPAVVRRLRVREVICRRFVPSQQRVLQ